MMVHEPHGVVAVVVPWNDPIAIACGYIGAALVYKPSEKTPLSAVWLATMFDGLAVGVLNLLLGDGRASARGPRGRRPRALHGVRTGRA
jgi:acyl-CoA reductase-like NAD-dependent aldehyde dehydrogenase